MIRAKVKTFEIVAECECCEGEAEIELDELGGEPSDALNQLKADGWIFKAEKGYEKSKYQECRRIYAFCDKDCFEEYLKREQEKPEAFVDIDINDAECDEWESLPVIV